MHQTDGDNHAAGLFVDGDPGVPSPGTQIEQAWLNAIQAEIITPITEAGITLVKGTNTQLRDALRVLFVRAAGTATQTITGIKTFTSRVIHTLAPGAAAAVLELINSDTVLDSNALKATSTSVGATADIRNSSTGSAVNAVNSNAAGGNAAVRAVHADGYAVECIAKTVTPVKAPLRITPQDNAPSSGVMGDLYVDSTNGKLYVYTTSWVLVGSQT